MNIDQFKLLKSNTETEINVTEDNISEKSIKFTSIYNKYLSLYIQELRILKKLTLDKDKIYGELYNKFKFNNNFQLDTNKEIDVYVRADDKYYNVSLDLQNQEMVVKYLEEVLQNINNTGYRIKNYIELQKLKQGLK
jgi:hypothetical protein